MNEIPYTKREEDAFRKRLFCDLKEIKTQVLLTNGKVKKIIIGMAVLSGITIGLGFNNLSDIIKIFL